MNVLRACMLVLCVVFAASPAGKTSAAADLDKLLERADLMLRLGVLEKGASHAFDEAGQLLEIVASSIAEADLSPADRLRLTLEFEAVREDLDLLTELYNERFYGVFPLARLISPTMLVDEGLAVSEQLFHPPDVAAVLIATRKLLNQLERYDHPHVVFRSSPNDRRLENVAAEVLLRDERSTPHMRRALVDGLDLEELEAFDRGEITPKIIDRLYTTFNAVSLLTLTVAQPTEIEDGAVILLQGDFYTPGEVIQGSPVSASPNIRTQSFSYIGFTLDRRDQYWPIVGIQLLLLGLAMVWAARIKWSLGKSLKRFYRSAIGAGLFIFGRAIMIACVAILGRFTPEATALLAAAWWWPAMTGLLAVIVGGLVAWLVQAQLTDIVPGARGERAVGSIFAIVALGACSFFVAPMLLLDEGNGLINVTLFVLSGVSLAVLFGFAARTGPPVPNYFMIGPLFMAPVLGVCLFTASPTKLWISGALTGLLCLAAWVRHRVALAHGTEEPELTAEEAAQADQRRLIKLGEKLKK
jgi:hypothetical protein